MDTADDQQDLFQEIVYQLRKSYDSFQEQSRFAGWVQLVTLIIAGFYGHVMRTPVLTVAYYCLYGVTLACCGYYAWRFYGFYRRLGTSVLSTSEHLYEVYYDIRLHIEMYRSLTYALMMSAFGLVIMYILTKPGVMDVTGTVISGWMVLKIVVIFMVFIVWVAAATEVWLRRCYGKYLKEIKKIKDELKEEI